MGKVTSIGNQEFAASVENTSGTVIVDFTASWCPPCKMLAPVLERVAEKFDGRATFYKVDVDENVEVAAKYGVSTIPNLLFFKDGQVVGQSVGFVPEGQLSTKVEETMSS